MATKGRPNLARMLLWYIAQQNSEKRYNSPKKTTPIPTPKTRPSDIATCPQVDLRLSLVNYNLVLVSIPFSVCLENDDVCRNKSAPLTTAWLPPLRSHSW
eukprot:m.218475 g.218475  ORF g.218475 m.218475 type:complete len:100 (-) comp15569_c0_seq31:223-522(-)